MQPEQRGRAKTGNLVIQTAFLGDLLLTIPLLKNFRRLYPQERLTILVRRGFGELITFLALVDEVIEVDKSSGREWSQAIRELRTRHWNVVLSPHQSPRTTLLVRSLRANRKVGYSGWLRNFVFTSKRSRSMDLPEVLRQLELLASLDDGAIAGGIQTFRAQQAAPGGQASADELSPVPEWASMEIEHLHLARLAFFSGSASAFGPEFRELLGKHELVAGRFVVLAPGSVWPTKMWTASGFAGVGVRLHSRGYKIILIGSPNEAEVCSGIQREIEAEIGRNSRPPAPPQSVIVLAGQISLVRTLELLSASSLLISNDSGAMHMAALANVPTVSVFGPTVLEFGYRPWQNNGRVVQISRVDLRCRPCGKHGALKCPIGTHECMGRISADQVLDAALGILARVK